MTVFIRIGLAILFLDELVVGAWNAISPETFYRHFPTVELTPPFSEHYARDFGGAALGIALLLGIALVLPKAHFVIPAALAFSVFAVPHFFYHAANLEGATVAEAVSPHRRKRRRRPVGRGDHHRDSHPRPTRPREPPRPQQR